MLETIANLFALVGAVTLGGAMLYAIFQKEITYAPQGLALTGLGLMMLGGMLLN